MAEHIKAGISKLIWPGLVWSGLVWSGCLEHNKLNGTAQFKKCKQLIEYQYFLLLETSGGQNFNLYLKVVHFFNTSVK